MRQFDLLRWRILLKILPFTLLFCLAKWGIYQLNWEIWKFDLMTGSLFGAATFVIAFILSGTLSDYRLSQDLITQIASSIETIQDTALSTAVNHPEYDPTSLSQGLAQALQSLLAWLHENQPLHAVNLAVTDLNRHFAQLEPFTSGPIISRIQGEQGKIRLSVARIQQIRDTDFLAAASVLLQLFLLGSIGALLFTSGEPVSKTLVVSGFLFTSFLYLVELIQDLDNPFQYDGKSAVEVELLALTLTLERLEENLRKRLA